MTLSLRRTGMLVVVSAPSGGGKSTVLRAVMDRMGDLMYSVSTTSRKPRGEEIEGRHYFFVSREEFQRRVEAGEFIEHAEVHGNFYGTPKAFIKQQLESGRDVAMDLDIQGGRQVKRRLPDALLIFLMPPSHAVLERRLRGRGTDAEESIQLRLANAKREMGHWPEYDYVVINENLEEAVVSVERIIRAERCRASRQTLTGSAAEE